MTSFQDRVLSLKGFLGKLLPRTVCRSRRSLDEQADEVSVPAVFLDGPLRLFLLYQARSTTRWDLY